MLFFFDETPLLGSDRAESGQIKEGKHGMKYGVVCNIFLL